MKKRTVGIYAKYDASEQSLCAEFLARYVVTCYRYAKWFSPHAPDPNSRHYGFSHQWDSEVIGWDLSKEARDTAKACDTFFFFEPNEELLSLLPKNATTAFILDPRCGTTEIQSFAKKCTWTLVTSDEWLKRYAFCDLIPNVMVWPFDPSVQCIPRKDIDYEKNPKLFFPAYDLSVSERLFAEQIAEIVKLCLPQVQTVVGYYDAKVTPKPGVDSRTHDWRLVRYLQNSDWLIDLNPRPFYLLFPAWAGGYGLQWIGFETTPNTDYYSSARRHLVRERINESALRDRFKVTPNLETTAEQIVSHVGTTFHGFLDRHRNGGAWDNRRAEFLRVTSLILGIKTRY